MKNTELREYYQRRAKMYDQIYHRDDPILLKELETLKNLCAYLFKGKSVIDIGCGTGYWTQIISFYAHTITAVDYSEEMIKQAKIKIYQCPIEFIILDLFNIHLKKLTFNSGLSSFIFSHIPKKRMNEFFSNIHSVFEPGAEILLIDNVYNPKYGGKLIKNNKDSNSHKIRELNNGKIHKIIKNYYSKQELFKLVKKFDPYLKKSEIFYGEYVWFVPYKLIQKSIYPE